MKIVREIKESGCVVVRHWLRHYIVRDDVWGWESFIGRRMNENKKS